MPEWISERTITAVFLAAICEAFFIFAWAGYKRTLPGHWTRLGWSLLARNIAFGMVAVDTYLVIFGWRFYGRTGHYGIICAATVTSAISTVLIHRRAENDRFWKDQGFIAWAIIAAGLPILAVAITFWIEG